MLLLSQVPDPLVQTLGELLLRDDGNMVLRSYLIIMGTLWWWSGLLRSPFLTIVLSQVLITMIWLSWHTKYPWYLIVLISTSKEAQHLWNHCSCLGERFEGDIWTASHFSTMSRSPPLLITTFNVLQRKLINQMYKYHKFYRSVGVAHRECGRRFNTIYI